MFTFSKPTRQSCLQIRNFEAFPDDLPFRDFDKSIFSAKDVRRMHQKDDAEEKDLIGKNGMGSRPPCPLSIFEGLMALNRLHSCPRPRSSVSATENLCNWV